MINPLTILEALLALVGVLTMCAVYQDDKTRKALKAAGIPSEGPSLANRLKTAAGAFIGSLGKKPDKVVK